MSVQSINTAVTGQNNLIPAWNQDKLETGNLRTTLNDKDRITLSASIGMDMTDEELEALLNSTSEQIIADPAEALSVHSGLDLNRALRLLEGIDEI